MPLCTVCGGEYTERGIKLHMTKKHPEYAAAGIGVTDVPRPAVKLTPSNDEEIDDALISQIPESEEELSGIVQRQLSAKAQVEAAAELKAEQERMLRRIRVSERLNKYVAKLTTAPILSGLNRINEIRNEGKPFAAEEEEAIGDSMDIFAELIGLQFEIDPILYTIKSVWIALAFALAMPLYVVLARPGLKKEEEPNVRPGNSETARRQPGQRN